MNGTVLAGIESRGFLIGAPVAHLLGLGFNHATQDREAAGNSDSSQL